jgi:hypothetical protein
MRYAISWNTGFVAGGKHVELRTVSPRVPFHSPPASDFTFYSGHISKECTRFHKRLIFPAGEQKISRGGTL